MRFWDSSAIVPLLVLEEETDLCLKALDIDPEAMVWTMSQVEVFSAICRRVREGFLSEDSLDPIKKRMHVFFDSAFEIVSIQKVKDRALRLLQVHSLKAADALQLASALVVTQEDPIRMPIMSFDNQLNQAAKREGFAVNPETGNL